jgi:hypothetical protein
MNQNDRAAFRSLGVTHAVKQQGSYLGFHFEKCERCGANIQGANAINLHESFARLINGGVTLVMEAPGEGGYSEQFGGVVCDDCDSELTKGDGSADALRAECRAAVIAVREEEGRSC